MDSELNQSILINMPESGGKDLKSNINIKENVNGAL